MEIHQTEWAMPVIRRFHARMLKDGISPWLTDILDEIKECWQRYGDEVPLTFLTPRRRTVDYWEPCFVRTFKSELAIIASATAMREKCDVEERLVITEAWGREESGKTELLMVALFARSDGQEVVTTHLFRIKQGKHSRYLVPHEELKPETHAVVDYYFRACFSPWSTVDDLIAQYEVSPEEEEQIKSVFLAGVEKIKKDFPVR